MIQLVLFVLVIALIYAAKTAAILSKHDEISEQSASFSWMSIRPEDEAAAASWTVEEKASGVSEALTTRSSLSSLRHAGSASA